MSREWNKFNFHNFWIPMIFFILGIIAGILFPCSPKQPQKEYPVKVEVCYETKGYWYNDAIECDSIKGDTIYKDSLSIINKNIVNITFK